ncbi:MAG TPA: DUF4388 domain-containing protein, partial [Candidatus Polarisedimenticolia bacterium]|nr:DUF4388 domain-containing protein [Candidatus Polarisedimenticolia bacterium]
MKGTLAQRSPFDVLGEVQRRQASGILRLQSGEVVRQLFIDAGAMIRFAASNLPAESMTALFKDKGGLTDDKIRQAAGAKGAQELLGTTLVRLGLMTRQLLADLTEAHIRLVLAGAAALQQGEFEFQSGSLPFREQLDSGLSTAEALLEWARSVTDLGWIRRRLGPTDAPIRFTPRPPEGYQAIPLNPAEGYTMSRVDGRATLHEICMVSPVGEETTLRALFGLAIAGILETSPDSANLPPPAITTSAAPAPAAPTPAARATSGAPTTSSTPAAAPATPRPATVTPD